MAVWQEAPLAFLVPFFGPLALVFFLMLPILNLFHKFLPSYIYWAQSWVRTGFKFIGQEIKLIFNTGIGLQQEFHINNVRISEEFHLRLTSLLPVSIKTKYDKVWLINKK